MWLCLLYLHFQSQLSVYECIAVPILVTFQFISFMSESRFVRKPVSEPVKSYKGCFSLGTFKLLRLKAVTLLNQVAFLLTAGPFDAVIPCDQQIGEEERRGMVKRHTSFFKFLVACWEDVCRRVRAGCKPSNV